MTLVSFNYLEANWPAQINHYILKTEGRVNGIRINHS